VTDFPPVTHVAVTVSDLDRSVEWYGRLFGAKPVLDEDTGAVPARRLGGGRHPGWAAPVPDLVSADSFSERRPGLDHIAFGCADRAELDTWASRLDELGISHGGIVDAGYGSGVSFRDPDNIALEFFAPPS